MNRSINILINSHTTQLPKIVSSLCHFLIKSAWSLETFGLKHFADLPKLVSPIFCTSRQTEVVSLSLPYHSCFGWLVWWRQFTEFCRRSFQNFVLVNVHTICSLCDVDWLNCGKPTGVNAFIVVFLFFVLEFEGGVENLKSILIGSCCIVFGV